MTLEAPQSGAKIDVLALLDRALEGDRLAYARMARLVSGYLNQWRAQDFRGDWDDIIQEVLVAAATARREGRIPNGRALRGFVRQTARFKFVDRLRARIRAPHDPLAGDGDAPSASSGPLAWPPEQEIGERALELRLAVRQALAALDERERVAVTEVYLRGKTYQECADATGIPLGTLKRALRTGMASLRALLDDEGGEKG
ncbi:MAG: RNA polymerase sigma factor [Myxococcota bacterium]